MNLLFADVALRGLDLTSMADHTRRIAEDSVLASLNISPFGRTSWTVIRKKDVELGREAVLSLMDRLAHAGAPCRRLLMSEPTAAAWLVRALMKAGNHDSAQSVVSTARQVASAAPEILSLRAGAVHAQGLFDRDADELRRAVSLHRGRLAVATATEDLAMMVAVREDSSDETPALLMEALAGYEAAKSPQDVARVKQRLRELGHTLRHPSPAGTRGDLSHAEHSVADLVAQGLTNAQVAERLFVSQHPVASHLRTIFRKLGLRSRVELARNWTRYDSVLHETT